MRRGAVAVIVLLASGISPLVAQTGSNAPLPADVHPESRNRLPPLKPGVQGLEAIRLYASGVDVRWLSPLGRQLTELAILTAARGHDQPYEWSLHEMEALAVGLDPAVIDIVRATTPFVPSNTMPGDTPIFLATALLYRVAWLAYLSRSKRVRAISESA